MESCCSVEIPIFAHLVSRQSSKRVEVDLWKLLEHSTDSNTAVFSWIEGSLVLGIKLGDKMKSKGANPPIGHWVIKRIHFGSLHRAES